MCFRCRADGPDRCFIRASTPGSSSIAHGPASAADQHGTLTRLSGGRTGPSPRPPPQPQNLIGYAPGSMPQSMPCTHQARLSFLVVFVMRVLIHSGLSWPDLNSSRVGRFNASDYTYTVHKRKRTRSTGTGGQDPQIEKWARPTNIRDTIHRQRWTKSTRKNGHSQQEKMDMNHRWRKNTAHT